MGPNSLVFGMRALVWIMFHTVLADISIRKTVIFGMKVISCMGNFRASAGLQMQLKVQERISYMLESGNKV